MKALFLLSVVLFAALAGIAGHWAFEHYRERPQTQVMPEDPRLRFRSSAYLAQEAVAHYRALPPNERRALNTDLLASLTDLDNWSQTEANSKTLVCLGERHHDAVRNFLALHVLPRLDYRVLMLETGEDGLARIKSSLTLEGGADLLGARIDGVMRAIGSTGVPPILVAIDENSRELERRARRTPEDRGVPSREQTLTDNVLRYWRDDSRHVVLMGALHCRDTPGWLFHRVASSRPPPHGYDMLAVAALARSQEAGARLLFYFLEELDIHQKILVIPDVSRFPRQILSWLPQVADAFAGYRSVLLFDDGNFQERAAPAN